MEIVWELAGLIVGVLLVGALARRLEIATPILLVPAGFLASLIPFVPSYRVDPDLILFLVLPPLLYAAASESSLLAIRKLIRPILGLAVGAVLATAITVGLVLHWLVPAIPLAAALALGAIVAPPDAVATVAIARRAGLPRRIVTLLEGESLFNDATSLVLLKVAALGITAGAFQLTTAVGDFAWAAGGGVALGVAVALAVSLARRLLKDTMSVTVLTLVTPFAAYSLGEELHASGVLVVVVAGLFLGYRSAIDVSASVRLTEAATWSSLRYALEGAVFALIGLQLWDLVAALDADGRDVAVALIAVPLVVIAIRPIWLMLGVRIGSISPKGTPPLSGPEVAVVSWAGMRGVISLAAAQTLPLTTPMRSLLIVCALVVIAATLLLQGLTLPWLIRRLGVGGRDREAELAARDQAQRRAIEEMHARIDALAERERIGPELAQRMREMVEDRGWRAELREDPEQVLQHGRSHVMRRRVIEIERQVFLEARRAGELPEEVLREMQMDLDLEEALLDRDPIFTEGGHLAELIDRTRQHPPSEP